jgi:kinesin family protein C1
MAKNLLEDSRISEIYTSNNMNYNLNSKSSINISTDLSIEKEENVNYNYNNNLLDVKSFKDYDENELAENLEQKNIENFEILEKKIEKKQEELNLIVENFDLFLKNEKDDIESQEILNQFEIREQELKRKLKNLEQILQNKETEKHSLNLSIKELMNELDKSELHRKRLHNYIQNLRGNLRVYCRVKPNVKKSLNIERYRKFRVE